MLSYQHIYHAGNMADVHKHALLAWMLDYLAQKPKPLTYIESHAGRGLYDLASTPAQKTREAAAGIAAVEGRLDPDHPYMRALARIRGVHGATTYPGSPLIARTVLRPDDKLHLAELHPQEYGALARALRGPDVTTYKQDGLALALSLSPPEPRRGLLLIDPSYEVKDDYATLPRRIGQIAKAWNVGVIALWYPILDTGVHAPMLTQLERDHPGALRHEIRFPPAREGHRMRGSGMFVINPPWGLDAAAGDLAARLKQPG